MIIVIRSLLFCLVLSGIANVASFAAQNEKLVRLRGRITDLMGQPLQDATIQLYERNWFNPTAPMTLAKTVVTNDKGEYLAESISYGYYLITVRCKGFMYTEVNQIIIRGEDTVFDIGLEIGKLTDMGPFKCSGTVKDAKGLPLPDAIVVLTSALNPSIRFQTRTNKSGQYNFELTIEGQFVLFATKSNYKVNVTSEYFSTLDSGKLVRKDFTLQELDK